MEEKNVFKIPLVNLEMLKERLADLNKKAIKTGSPAVTIEVLKTYSVEVKLQFEQTGELDRTVTRWFAEVIVEGMAPKFNGWTFAGTLEHTEAGNIMRAIPGMEIPEDFRNIRKACSHCQKDRNRKDTYLVVSEQGEWKQLGKGCLRDYTGHVSPQYLAQLASFEADLAMAEGDEAWGAGARAPRTVEVVPFLQAACQAVINQNGYITKGQAQVTNLQATSVLAWIQFFPMSDKDREQLFVVTEAAIELAHKVILHIESLEGRSGFEANVLLTYRKGEIIARDAGILAAAIMLYQKDLIKKLEFNDRSKSQYVGELKKRQNFELTHEKTLVFESQFGTMVMHFFFDASGNIFVWKTRPSFEVYEPTRKYMVKATVIKHEDYKGIRQTRINRVVQLKDITPNVFDARHENC